MICDERKLCFVHIPKCAGTTITRLLDFKSKSVEHRTLRAYTNKRGYEDMNTLFKFCFVRNPWDRLVSWYYYHSESIYKPRTQKMFRSWVSRGCPHHWKKMFMDDVDWSKDTPLNLHSWLTPVGPIQFDKIFKTEEYDYAVEFLNDMLGLNLRNITYNKSTRADYRHYYDAATVQKVYELFPDDIDRFGYEF